MLSLRQLRKWIENTIFPPEKAFERVVGNLNPSWKDKLIVLENCGVNPIIKPSIRASIKNIYKTIFRENTLERIFELPSLIKKEKDLYFIKRQEVDNAIAEIRVQAYIYDKLPKIPNREWYCGITTTKMREQGFLDITVGYWDNKAFIITRLIEVEFVDKMPSDFINIKKTLNSKGDAAKKLDSNAELELFVIYDKWVPEDVKALEAFEKFKYTEPLFKITCKAKN